MTIQEAAVLLSSQGFRIFPLRRNGRLPIRPNWPNTAAANALPWQQHPYANIGVATGYNPLENAYLVVVDLDMKEGKNGVQALTRVMETHNAPLPPTFMVRTPSGGFHAYYWSTKPIKNSVQKFGEGIDIRGENGYVVAPYSTTPDGIYAVSADDPIAYLPQWFEDLLERHNPRETEDFIPSSAFSLDSKASIRAAVHYLLNDAPEAIQGSAGDQTTFAVAAALKDIGVSPNTAYELLLENWNDTKASPPWAPRDLKQKVQNAFRYGSNAPGVTAANAQFEPFDKNQPFGDSQNPSSFSLPSLAPFDPASLPRRRWIFGSIFLEGKVTVVVAPPGAGKSTFTLAAALSIASNIPFLGIKTYNQFPVAIYNNEDDLEEMQRRTAAIMQHHSLKFQNLLTSALKPTLFMESGENKLFQIAKKVDGKLLPFPITPIVEWLTANNIKLFIVDPFAETHGANENDNAEILKVAQLYRHIAQQAQCAVCLVHHTNKPQNASAEGRAGDMNTARGASSLAGVARVMLTLYSMTKKDAENFHIPPEERHLYVRLDDAKTSMSLNPNRPFWFKRISIPLHSYDTLNAPIIHLNEGQPYTIENVGSLEPVSLISVEEANTDFEKALIEDILAVTADGKRRSLRQFWTDLQTQNESLYTPLESRKEQDKILSLIRQKLQHAVKIEDRISINSKRRSFYVISVLDQHVVDTKEGALKSVLIFDNNEINGLY